MGLLNDLDEYAKLLSSIGTHKRERPLLPVEVAKRIKILKDECTSLNEVSERLSLDAKLIGQFLSLLNLPETVHGIIGWGHTDKFRLGFTKASIIAELEDSNDQDILAKAAQISAFKKQEIRDVISLKKRNADKKIEECIESVLSFRPVIEKGYMMITNIKPNTIKRLHSAIRGHSDKIEDLIKQSMETLLPLHSLSNVAIRENYVVLNLNEEGYKKFEKLPVELQTESHSVTDVCINKFLNMKQNE